LRYGPARQLEGVFAAVARDMPHRIVPRDLGIREDQFQQDQQEDRSPDPLPQGRRRNWRKVSNEDIIKGYQVDKDRYLEVTKDELENIALESTRTIEIDKFVPRRETGRLPISRFSWSGLLVGHLWATGGLLVRRRLRTELS
jgi:hypothetical protein